MYEGFTAKARDAERVVPTNPRARRDTKALLESGYGVNGDASPACGRLTKTRLLARMHQENQYPHHTASSQDGEHR
jgi:hypothetical protein